MKQTFFSFGRMMRASCLLFAMYACIIAGCAKSPTSTTPASQGVNTNPISPTNPVQPEAVSLAGRYREIDSNWIPSSCWLTRFTLALDSSSTATQLAITDGLVAAAAPSSDTTRLHALPIGRFDGNAAISSSTKKGDSVVVVFTMNKYDQPYTLTAAVAGDTLRGRLQWYRKELPVVAVRERLN